jgi:hypothetical protein
MTTTARGYLFEGSLYMARYISGVLQPLQGPLEGTVFGIQPNVTQKEMVSKGRGTTGQVLESVGIQQPADFTVTLVEGTPEVLALGLMGSVAALTQASGSLTAESITVAGLDVWYPLSKANLTSAAATVTNTGATTTYVENTDYILNREMGMIKPLSTGAIVAGALLVSAAYSATTGSLISGANTADLRVKFVLDGRNLVDGNDCIVTVDEAIISPSAAIEFLSGNFIEVPLKGRMKTQLGKTSPFTVEVRDAP